MTTGSDKNFYELLGVDSKATTEQIRAAYRELARVFHPDSNFYAEIIQDDPDSESEQLFKLITDAYNTLTDEAKRKMYDGSLAPSLRDWDEDTGETSREKPTGTRTRMSAGFEFGSGARKSTLFDSVVAKDVKSVNEMIKERTTKEKFLTMLSYLAPVVALLTAIGVFVSIM